jgi:hypothetical protein
MPRSATTRPGPRGSARAAGAPQAALSPTPCCSRTEAQTPPIKAWPPRSGCASSTGRSKYRYCRQADSSARPCLRRSCPAAGRGGGGVVAPPAPLNIRVNREWKWLFRAVDKHGRTRRLLADPPPPAYCEELRQLKRDVAGLQRLAVTRGRATPFRLLQ